MTSTIIDSDQPKAVGRTIAISRSIAPSVRSRRIRWEQAGTERPNSRIVVSPSMSVSPSTTRTVSAAAAEAARMSRPTKTSLEAITG